MERKRSEGLLEPFTSRFEMITSSLGRVSVPAESIGIRSAQYLGKHSTERDTTLEFDGERYVLERRN
jgi:hypothetical protein